MSRFPIIAAATLLAATFANPAFAHLGHAEYGSFAAGFSHPLFGLDHIMAMVAVGLWAAVLGGRALWVVPAAFVGTMLVGFLAAVAGLPLVFVEPMILASIVVIGLLIAMSVRIDLAYGAGLVALFAFFHGHAHGGELGGAGAVQFGLGFVIATTALHAAGVGLGLLIGRSAALQGIGLRALGAVTAATGVVLAFG